MKKNLISRGMHYINKARFRKTPICRIAVSDKAGEWLFGKESYFTVINNGVDIEAYRYSYLKRKRIRSEFGISDNTLVIGNVGAFLPAKNHMFLIDVFCEVLKEDKEAILLLAGDGEKRSQIHNRVIELGMDSNVLLIGNRSDIQDVFCAMDVLVMPSLFEGFPNVVLEAQTSGLPCVLSDIITREVEVDNCTYISLQVSPNEWAKQILNTYNCLSDIQEKRERAFLTVEKAGFSLKDSVRRLEEVYQEITKQ